MKVVQIWNRSVNKAKYYLEELTVVAHPDG